MSFIRGAGCAFQTPNAPVITSNGGGSTATVSVSASNKPITTVIAKASTTRVYSISGRDYLLTTINPSTGVLAFTNPSSAGTYLMTATATTDYGSDSQDLTVTVT